MLWLVLMINKLIQITTNKHKLEYGTILSVKRIHRNRVGYMATEAENIKVVPIYVPFKQCKEI